MVEPRNVDPIESGTNPINGLRMYIEMRGEGVPWEHQDGTTFYFVSDGINSALEQAKSAAGGEDIR